MSNNLLDLNAKLFEQMDKLSKEDISSEELEKEIAKVSRLYQLPIETLSSPYHLRVYSQGEGTDLTGSWYGLGMDLVINQQISRGFPSSELSF